jgi:hypothetical protein
MAEQASDLYGVAPGEFITQRNALAAALKKAGHAEEADAVKALRKPKVAEYALNRAARDEPALVATLVSAATAANAAQSEAIGGRGENLRAATTALRAATNAVVEAAVGALRAEGGPGETQRDEITSVLRDLIAADAMEQLTAGTVSAATIPGSKELFAGAPDPPPAPLKQDSERQRRRAELSQLETQRKRTAAEVARLEQAAEGAEAAFAKAEAQLDDVRARLATAREEADTIADRMRELE